MHRLIQSASEVAAVVTPYWAIHEVFSHRAKYSGNGEDMVSWDYPSSSALSWYGFAVWSYDSLTWLHKRMWYSIDKHIYKDILFGNITTKIKLVCKIFNTKPYMQQKIKIC